MEFTEFVNLLKPIIGGAENTHSFVKTLFDVVVTEEGKPFFRRCEGTNLQGLFQWKNKNHKNGSKNKSIP